VLTAGILATMLAGVTIVRLNRWPWFDRRNGPRLGPEHRRTRTPLLGSRQPAPAAKPAGQ
jgi:hypothetical protein